MGQVTNDKCQMGCSPSYEGLKMLACVLMLVKRGQKGSREKGLLFKYKNKV